MRNPFEQVIVSICHIHKDSNNNSKIITIIVVVVVVVIVIVKVFFIFNIWLFILIGYRLKRSSAEYAFQTLVETSIPKDATTSLLDSNQQSDPLLLFIIHLPSRLCSSHREDFEHDRASPDVLRNLAYTEEDPRLLPTKIILAVIGRRLAKGPKVGPVATVQLTRNQ